MRIRRRIARRPSGRPSRRTRRSLALVFALVFAPAAQRAAHAECVPFANPPAISEEGNVFQAVVAADFDGDGDLDVAAAAGEYGNITLYPNNGSALFGPPTAVSTLPVGVSALEVADLDGDADLDLVETNFVHNRIVWHENDGAAGGWTVHSVLSVASPFETVAADVDRDGDLDLVAALATDSAIVWLENDGDGGGWAVTTIDATVTLARPVVAADVDGDGDVDAVSADWLDGALAWHENDGAGGGWTRHEIATAPISVYSLAAADLDADGDLDLVAGSFYLPSSILWFENDGSGGGAWTASEISTTTGSVTAIRTGDFDADGDVDLLSSAANSNALHWHENLGGGDGWARHTLAVYFMGASGAATGDLDGDGDLDALGVAVSLGRLDWFRNDHPHGTALLGAAQTVTAELAHPVSVRAGDIDGDGDLDLISQSADDNFVAWYANDGDGADWALGTIVAGSYATGAWFSAPADVDGDGDLDVVTAAWGNRTDWHENVDLTEPGSGNGSLWSLHTVSTVTHSIQQIATGDVDGDGDLDLVTASAAPGNSLLAWHRHDDPYDDNGWPLITISAAVDQVTSVAVADLDRDGDLDVVSSSTGTPEWIAWWQNDGGDGTAWIERTIAAVADPENVVLADIDRDGDDDVVAAIGGGGGGAVWYENPRGEGTWTRVTVAAGAPFLSSNDVAAVDFDGDGDLDVLVASFYPRQLAWAENLDGDGASWTTHVLSTADDVTHVVAADLDGDGDADAAAVSRIAGRLDWYENRNSHLFSNGLDSESPESANLACWSADVP